MTGQTAGILYAGGTAAEMQYDALNRLTRVKDSLGETSIRRDRTGKITAVTDHNGQTVSYEWGAQGERKSTTYPNGQQTASPRQKKQYNRQHKEPLSEGPMSTTTGAT